MTIAHIRNLSQYGVLNDVDAYNLPPEAFSMAVNARFQNGSVVRAPVFRRVPVTLLSGSPRFLTSNSANSGFDSLYVGYMSGIVTEVKSTIETDRTIFGFVTNSVEAPWTSCHLGDVFYVNRSDRTPWARRVTDTIFQKLDSFGAAPDRWDPTWRANILRSSNSALCAFGITKGATFFPTMVKTSEFAQVNTVPPTWNAADPTNNSTENVLADMEGQITEANNLGEIMVVYGLTETWTMVANGSNAVWQFHKLFRDAGCINVNCSIEVDRKHYVFGPTDIWVHDGNSKRSICDNKTRKFIFSNINLKQSNRCFVSHDPNRKEIRFNFIGGDQLIAFVGATGCNRSAVYNYVDDNWTYDDLPGVYGTAVSNLDTSLTYTTVTSSYDAIGGSYLDQDDSLKKILCATGDALGTSTIYAIDQQGPGSLIAYPVDANATRPVTLIRDGIDLDGLPDLEDLRGYKVLSSIYPQARFEPGAQPLSFTVGGADNYNQNVVFSDPQTYDANVFTRCDFNTPGRYLSMRITHNDFHWFTLTGLDLDVDVTGQE